MTPRLRELCKREPSIATAVETLAKEMGDRFAEHVLLDDLCTDRATPRELPPFNPDLLAPAGARGVPRAHGAGKARVGLEHSS